MTQTPAIPMVPVSSSFLASLGDDRDSETLALEYQDGHTFHFSDGPAEIADAAKTIADLGQSLAGANSRVDDQNQIEQIVRTQRDGVSGVSLDEEMANLLKYQRAFQASSRVFTTIDDLLDNVVNNLGR